MHWNNVKRSTSTQSIIINIICYFGTKLVNNSTENVFSQGILKTSGCCLHNFKLKEEMFMPVQLALDICTTIGKRCWYPNVNPEKRWQQRSTANKWVELNVLETTGLISTLFPAEGIKNVRDSRKLNYLDIEAHLMNVSAARLKSYYWATSLVDNGNSVWYFVTIENCP